MPVLILTTSGFTDIKAKFSGMAERVQDVEPAAGLIVDVFRKAAKETFDMMGERGDGEAWVPDTMETMVRKIREGLDPRTEFATHALYKSLTTAGTVRKSRSSVSLGSGVRYAKYQTRQLIKLTVEDRDEIRQIWIGYVMHG